MFFHHKEKISEVLAIAKEVSGNDKRVMKELKACVKNTEDYYEKHTDRFEKRDIHEFFEEEPIELQWIAMTEVLCEYGYACECVRLESLESFVEKINGLQRVKQKGLITVPEWFEENDTIESWIRAINNEWCSQSIGIRIIKIDADCYICLPYEMGEYSKYITSIEKPHGKVQMFNDDESIGIVEYVDSITVCTAGGEKKYEKGVLTEKTIVKLLDETLSGVWNKLVMEFSISEEGEYIKRLDKYIYKNRTETLVIFSELEGLALIYFCRKDLECYKLISRCNVAKEVEIPVGNIKLLKCIVHKDRKAIDKGVYQIFQNIENVNRVLDSSESWCPECPAGKNGFNKICRQYGVAEEI